MPAPIDIRALAERFNAEAELVARALLPRGHREGLYWVEARRAEGGLGDSLKVIVGGPKRGHWDHYAASKHGDMLDLVEYVNRCAKAEAIGWARRFLGLDAGQALVRATPEEEIARRQA